MVSIDSNEHVDQVHLVEPDNILREYSSVHSTPVQLIIHKQRLGRSFRVCTDTPSILSLDKIR